MHNPISENEKPKTKYLKKTEYSIPTKFVQLWTFLKWYKLGLSIQFMLQILTLFVVSRNWIKTHSVAEWGKRAARAKRHTEERMKEKIQLFFGYLPDVLGIHHPVRVNQKPWKNVTWYIVWERLNVHRVVTLHVTFICYRIFLLTVEIAHFVCIP